MNRKTLCRKIQLKNNKLNLRQAQFSLINERFVRAMKKQNPYLVVGVGVLAGLVTRGVGLRKVYSLLRTGSRLYSFMISRYRSLDESNNHG